MLYYLFEYLEQQFQIPGASVFQYLTFRAALAAITALLFSFTFGKQIILWLQQKQVGEIVRDLGLKDQKEKAGTPTMGGVIIILATLIPVLLFCKLNNIYVIILLISTLWIGAIGFLDDSIKTFKKNKDGLAGKFKIIGQVGLGIIVGSLLYFNDNVVIKEPTPNNITQNQIEGVQTPAMQKTKSTKTTIPFFKNHELDYADVLKPFTDDYKDYTWLIFIPVVIFIITAVSNGANLTDGMDGLAAGTSAISVTVLMVLAWLSGNIITAEYLNIMYVPNLGELVVFSAAFIGALIGFLWYNTHPAQIFMGDTGSLTIGGIIAVLALATRKELLLPLICGIFFVENLSVMLQVAYFKYTKKKYGEGKRIFKMAPLHHHYQKLGYNETKIVVRFWIVGLFLAILTFITLKLR